MENNKGKVKTVDGAGNGHAGTKDADNGEDLKLAIVPDELDPPSSKPLNKVTLMQFNGILTDFKIICQNEFFYCHKLIMAAASTYLKNLFQGNQVTGMFTAVMNNVNPEDIKRILKYVYEGEARVPKGEVSNFLKAAELLHIDGLVVDEGANRRLSDVTIRSQAGKDKLGLKDTESPIAKVEATTWSESLVDEEEVNSLVKFMSSTKIGDIGKPTPSPSFTSLPRKQISDSNLLAKVDIKKKPLERSGSLPALRVLQIIKEAADTEKQTEAIHPKLQQQGRTSMRVCFAK